MPAVVSLPFGATSAKRFISKHLDDIRKRFKKVILSFDDDEPGHKAVKDATLIMPEALSVTLPYKDANECLMEGKAKEAFKAFSFMTHKPINTSLIFAPDIHLRARVPAKWGEMAWPFEQLNDLTRGIRYGETYYIGAGVKTGKSELRDEIAAGIMKDGKRVLMCSFEEAVNKTYKKLSGKIASRILYDPKKEFDYEAYDKAGEVLADKLALLDIYQQATVEACQQNLIKGAEWGAKAMFIDPITNFTNGVDAATSNTILQGFAQSLQQLARDLEVSIFIYCHLKEPDGNISNESRASYYKQGKYRGLGNCSHEYGGTVLSSQFAGSRGMMRSCNYMLGIEANKDKDLPKEIRNVRDIILLEDREFGEVGSIPVYWDDATGRFTEIN
jgi:twinkle protein